MVRFRFQGLQPDIPLGKKRRSGVKPLKNYAFSVLLKKWAHRIAPAANLGEARKPLIQQGQRVIARCPAHLIPANGPELYGFNLGWLP